MSKTDPFRAGVNILIYRNRGICCCPVQYMYMYLTQWRQVTDVTAMQSSNIPLFIDEHGEPFMREKFLSYVRQVLSRIGCDENKYCGHSFRIGAATSAADCERLRIT